MLRLTRQQVRQVDRLAVEVLGIPGIVLMENAGRNAAVAIVDLLAKQCNLAVNQAQVAILCGGGNNAGDGYVIARHLRNAGASVTVYAFKDPRKLTGDAGVNHHICAQMGVSIYSIATPEQLAAQAPNWAKAHVVVDALLGTGFTGAVRADLAGVIQRCNDLSGPKIVAVDVPSGLDCNTGQPSNATIQADMTVTFVASKTGFVADEALPYVGEVIVADIGTPPKLIDQVIAADPG